MKVHKKCRKCGLSKPIYEFYRDPRVADGAWGRCKTCVIEDNSQRRSANLELYREKGRKAYHAAVAANPRKFRQVKFRHYLKWSYGITLEERDEMMKAQGGRCRICARPFEPGRAYVDHCHDFKVVRGLLCPGCNTLVGFIEKNRAILHKALDYILESDQPEVGGA